MAGAAPADDLAPPLWADSRAHTALVQVLRLLPLDVRARAACVCRTWRDAAADPALFATLWLDDSSAGELNNKILARLCARAGAALRELRLDVPGRLCEAVTSAGVIAALNACGCTGVQRLTLSTSTQLGNASQLIAEQAVQLAAACPTLAFTACCVRCFSAEDMATACANLPGPLTLLISIYNAEHDVLQLRRLRWPTRSARMPRSGP